MGSVQGFCSLQGLYISVYCAKFFTMTGYRRSICEGIYGECVVACTNMHADSMPSYRIRQLQKDQVHPRVAHNSTLPTVLS